MDTHVKIIDALANGINPITGEYLAADSLYNHPDIIRAMFTTLKHLNSPPKKKAKVKKTTPEKQAENIERGLPRNAGLPWLEEQRNELAEQFNLGTQIQTLANVYERTSGAITAELKKQGLIDD